MRIEIIGNIASGKTTLAKLLPKEVFYGLYENFLENPFWVKFYENPSLYSFETEITFTLQHYHQIKVNASRQSDFICDYSLTLDRAYAEVTLKNRKRHVYEEVLSEIENEVGVPDILIYLVCPEEKLLERINKRGRSTESAISISYLRQLTDSISKQVQVMNNRTKLLTIDSEDLNFAYKEADKLIVKEQVMSAINEI